MTAMGRYAPAAERLALAIANVSSGGKAGVRLCSTARRIVLNLPQAAHSLLRQPRLAQSFERDRIRVCARDRFDGEFRTETTGLRQSGLRVVHLAFERIGGRKLPVRVACAKTGIDRPVD